MEQGYKFTGKIAEDKGAMQKIFANCDDILQRDMTLGAEHGIAFYFTLRSPCRPLCLKPQPSGSF